MIHNIYYGSRMKINNNNSCSLEGVILKTFYRNSKSSMTSSFTQTIVQISDRLSSGIGIKKWVEKKLGEAKTSSLYQEQNFLCSCLSQNQAERRGQGS